MISRNMLRRLDSIAILKRILGFEILIHRNDSLMEYT